MGDYTTYDEKTFARKNIRPNDINLDNIEHITGIKHLDILKSDALGVNFILLGDIHVISRDGLYDQADAGKIIYLPYYLDALFKKHEDKQFDLMIESVPDDDNISLDDNLKRYKDTVIKSTMIQFGVCYQGINNRSECRKEWPNVRFHEVDVRYYLAEDINKNKNAIPIHASKISNIIIQLQMINNVLFKSDETNIIAKTHMYNNLVHIINHLQSLYRGTNNLLQIMENIRNEKAYKEKYAELTYIEQINDYISNHMTYILYSHDIINQFLTLSKKKIGDISMYELKSIGSNLLEVYYKINGTLMDYNMLIKFNEILSHGCKNVVLLLGNYHIGSFKNFIKSIDPNSRFIRGSCELNDELYNLYKTFMNTYYNNPFEVRHRLGTVWVVKALQRIQKEILRAPDKCGNINTHTLLNLAELIDNESNYISEAMQKIVSNPKLRYVQIRSELIESSLI